MGNRLLITIMSQSNLKLVLVIDSKAMRFPPDLYDMEYDRFFIPIMVSNINASLFLGQSMQERVSNGSILISENELPNREIARSAYISDIPTYLLT